MPKKILTLKQKIARSNNERAYRQMRRDNGLCAGCGKPRDSEYLICNRCSNTRRKGNRFYITFKPEISDSLRSVCNKLNVRLEDFVSDQITKILAGV